MLKYIYTFLAITLITSACTNNESKKSQTQDSVVTNTIPTSTEREEDLTNVITRFVRAYITQDNDKANKLIHPDLGFTVIYRPGVVDAFVRVDSIDFRNPIPEYYAYPEITNDFSLMYTTLPTFDCGTEKWSKLGFYCDTTVHPLQLSNIIAFDNTSNEDKISEDELLKIENDEQNSFRVILTSETPLIFHVQLYKGAWYVTTLDRAYGTCEA